MSPNADEHASTQPPPPVDELQFQTAEAVDRRRRCATCNSALERQFYQVQGVDICEPCATSRRALQELPDSRQKFLRAFLYGSGAAFASWAVWSIVVVMTGFQVGILAISVGWVVGTAIKKGTDGHTSRKYQVMAVALTYLAIAMSFIPLLISEMVKKGPAAVTKQEAAKGKTAPETVQPAGPPPSLAVALVTIAVAVVTLVGLAVVSPVMEAFMDFPGGLIGLFIVFLGLQRAWQLTKPDDALITGPFELTTTE